MKNIILKSFINTKGNGDNDGSSTTYIIEKRKRLLLEKIVSFFKSTDYLKFDSSKIYDFEYSSRLIFRYDENRLIEEVVEITSNDFLYRAGESINVYKRVVSNRFNYSNMHINYFYFQQVESLKKLVIKKRIQKVISIASFYNEKRECFFRVNYILEGRTLRNFTYSKKNNEKLLQINEFEVIFDLRFLNKILNILNPGNFQIIPDLFVKRKIKKEEVNTNISFKKRVFGKSAILGFYGYNSDFIKIDSRIIEEGLFYEYEIEAAEIFNNI